MTAMLTRLLAQTEADRALAQAITAYPASRGSAHYVLATNQQAPAAQPPRDNRNRRSVTARHRRSATTPLHARAI